MLLLPNRYDRIFCSLTIFTWNESGLWFLTIEITDSVFSRRMRRNSWIFSFKVFFRSFLDKLLRFIYSVSTGSPLFLLRWKKALDLWNFWGDELVCWDVDCSGKLVECLFENNEKSVASRRNPLTKFDNFSFDLSLDISFFRLPSRLSICCCLSGENKLFLDLSACFGTLRFSKMNESPFDRHSVK